MNADTLQLWINDTEHSLGNHSQTTYQLEFSSLPIQSKLDGCPVERVSHMVSDKLTLIELRSRLELYKLNDNNSIIEIMGISELNGEWNIIENEILTYFKRALYLRKYTYLHQLFSFKKK